MRLPKINKYAAMLVIAVVLAIVSVTLIVQYLHQTQSQYQAELHRRLTQGTVAVVVPNKNLPPGTRVSGRNMSQRLFPQDLLYPDTVTARDWPRFAGKILRRPVEAGKPLLSSYFDKLEVTDFASLLPQGMRAVTITVDDVNAIAGLLRPGDRIDVMLDTAGREGSQTQELLPLLHRVLVLATGNDLGFSNGLPTPGEGLGDQFGTITLQLTPRQASEAILARQLGSLHVALTPGFAPVGAPTMPMQSSSELLSMLSGAKPHRELRRVHGVAPVLLIIGSAGGVTTRVIYWKGSGIAGPRPGQYRPPTGNIEQHAKAVLRRLLRGGTSAPATSSDSVLVSH